MRATDHEPHHTSRVFDRVLVLMFENHYRSYVLANPYMHRLARQGVDLANFFGVMHPSQTNYIASIAGSLCNVVNDDRPPLSGERTIVDLIEEAPGQLGWKAYMESYIPQATPWTPDFTPADAHPYYIKHNPFSSFANIVRDEERWRRIEGEAAFFADVLNGTLPEYAWFSPNIWNDGHWVHGTIEDCKPRAPALVDQLARWLEGFFGLLRFPGPETHLPPGTLVVVTFDEADFEADYTPELNSVYDGPNQIYTVLLGDGITPGVEEEGYNHYSLLRTIERNFGLGDLDRNDAESNWFQFLWGRHFRWGAAVATPVAQGDAIGGLCAAGFGGALFVGHAGLDGTMRIRTRVPAVDGQPDGTWSEPETVAVDGSGGAALAATGAELVLVARSAAGALRSVAYDLLDGWSATPEELTPADAATFALSAYDGGRRLMLAVSDTAGNVASRVRRDGVWKRETPVAAATTRPGGALALGALGATLLLVVQAPQGDRLHAITLNSAPYNVVTVAPFKYGGHADDSTIDRWSPAPFPVAHFASRPDVHGEWQPEAEPYSGEGPLALATLDGVVHLVHPAPASPLLLTETFSLAGLLTPSTPVTHKHAKVDVACNGFGTAAEAGWSRQTPLDGSRCEPGGALALATAGTEVVLLVQPRPGAAVELRIGRYELDAP